MLRGGELEREVYEAEHIRQVMAEIERNFPKYFLSFALQSPAPWFTQAIEDYESEREKYRAYLDLEALEEYDFDPNAFKTHTRNNCPIIRRCLLAQDEVMKAYKRSFADTRGSALLDAVRHIAEFGHDYAAAFDDDEHENASSYGDLGLEALNDEQRQCAGVIGYGIQSSLLHGLYGRCFAHRSQNAVWTLYFLSGRKSFELLDGSEFLIADAAHGTCEQNFFYPAELFGYYALWVHVLLEAACLDHKVVFDREYRYVYTSAFCDHVADRHREDINTLKWSSEHVESRPYFWR